MDDGMIIRPVGDEDVRAHVDHPTDRWLLLDHLAHGRGVPLFAFRDSLFLGQLFVRLAPPDEPELDADLPGVPLLQHLRVVDGYQRNGVGRRLIERAEAYLTVRGHRVVALGVDPGDTRVISFYRSLSFRPWREQTLTTFREEVRDDGTTVREVDQCLIFVKTLGRP